MGNLYQKYLDSGANMKQIVNIEFVLKLLDEVFESFQNQSDELENKFITISTDLENKFEQMQNDINTKIETRLKAIEDKLIFSNNRNIITNSQGNLVTGLPANTTNYIPTAEPINPPNGYTAIWVTS